ncbi:thiol reductant ABC exporter subunit CydD [Lentilactobacillus curieae]|uniref:Thiol reductant ABC exporter subunit CydD n=1 Tax=Lentilactobacillus curieae TaxID=1138822 RepID=A0A1S6QL58_9LACO|nr:thiol reductant ABC exporter subunit CydD [Lentilactobacillus curieae]AQW22354.1 thiol reductant ABC exporter subunit CydD [Lentilactobacillus curieae]
MIDKRLFDLPGMRKNVSILAVLVFIQAFAIIFQARYLAIAIVNLWSLKPLSSIVIPMIIFGISFMIRHIITVAQNRLFFPFVETTSKNMRNQLMSKLFKLGPAEVEHRGTGNMVTMALEGIDQVQTYLMLVMIKILDMSITPWLILVYIAFLQFKQGIFLLIIYPVIILFMVILGLAAQSRADRQYEGYQRLSNHFVDTLRGLPTLKQLGLSKSYAKNVYGVSESYRKETMSTLTIAMTSTFALDFFTTLSIAVVAVFLGFDLMWGKVTLLPALTILTLAPEYFLPIRNFANDYHATLNGKNAMTAVLEVLNEPTTKDRDKLPESDWKANSELQVQDASVTYGDSKIPALKNVNFDITGMTKVGIIGKSGSGKSTLLNMIGGFLKPDQGDAITLNGNKLPHLDQENWQKQFMYIPQNPYIFHDTLANNVSFYVDDADTDKINAAIDKAGLSEWVKSLPDGLNTLIGEGGRSVSGGQAQRIALARAFLDKNRKVLLFDEPTAHLDIETEVGLKEDILPVFNDHLVFFATHRLHWINEMDYVLVMDHGEIVEQGTPQQLAAQSGMYTELRAEMEANQL